ncbi:MAG: hypothetical protein JO128_11695 [Alphaproteobacteria bacterium]|nr:hypothetical protein [Alphaproteobacteria bacterium]
MATYQEASDALSTAISKLSDAYKAANSADDKDKVFAAMEVLQDELNEVTAHGLAASTKQYEALTATFKSYKAQLDQVRDDINNIVKYAKLASDVIAALQKVAALFA